MIARRWHGVVPSSKASEYQEYMEQTGVAAYQATPGNRGVYLFRRDEGDLTHFEILTFWESLAAVHAFAGDDIERARYYDRDVEFLVELEPFVAHFEVLPLGSAGTADAPHAGPPRG